MKNDNLFQQALSSHCKASIDVSSTDLFMTLLMSDVSVFLYWWFSEGSHVLCGKNFGELVPSVPKASLQILMCFHNIPQQHQPSVFANLQWWGIKFACVILLSVVRVSLMLSGYLQHNVFIAKASMKLHASVCSEEKHSVLPLSHSSVLSTFMWT